MLLPSQMIQPKRLKHNNYYHDKDGTIKTVRTIKPLNRLNVQYGWYVYIDRIKADFGGVHIPLEESEKCAREFIQKLKNQLAT